MTGRMGFGARMTGMVRVTGGQPPIGVPSFPRKRESIRPGRGGEAGRMRLDRAKHAVAATSSDVGEPDAPGSRTRAPNSRRSLAG